jgi:hypothetical protein
MDWNKSCNAARIDGSSSTTWTTAFWSEWSGIAQASMSQHDKTLRVHQTKRAVDPLVQRCVLVVRSRAELGPGVMSPKASALGNAGFILGFS